MINILNKVLHTPAKICNAVTLFFFFMLSAHATSVTLPYSFTAGSPISASQMMSNFASITSALSSTVSSPWVVSSSNIYFNTGSVGIGSSAPTRTLDVNGSMNVSGNVGIGVTNPLAPLHVANSTSINASGYLLNAGGAAGTYSGYNPISIYSGYSVLSAGFVFWALSDKRIKTDILPLISCLSLVSKLNPVTYNYKDKYLYNNHSKQTGFIAQDVQQVYPDAVHKETGYVPNIYKVFTVSVNENKLILKNTLDVSISSKVKVFDINNDEFITIYDGKNLTLTHEDRAIQLSENNTVFIYGSEIDDKLILEKDALFTLCVGAVKELNTDVQVKMRTLNEKIAKLEKYILTKQN